MRLLLCLFAASLAGAHSMYQSAILLDLRPTSAEAELQLPIDRLSISFRRTVDAAHFPGEKDALQSYVLSHIQPVTEDNRPFTVHFRTMDIQNVEGAPYLVVRLGLTPPAGASAKRFQLNYDVITHEIVTHVALVSLRSGTGEPIAVGVLRGERKSLLVEAR